MALLIDCAQFCRCNGYLQTASNTASETTLAGDEAVIATKAILTRLEASTERRSLTHPDRHQNQPAAEKDRRAYRGL